jgi:hypothetical protein
MYKVIHNERSSNRYDLFCYYYIHEANMHSLLYSISNIDIHAVERYLQGVVDSDSVEDVKTIVLLTNQPAYVSDEGVVTAVA